MPIPVRWAGFESDTYTLGRAGWQIALNESLNTMELQLVMHHSHFGLSAVGRMRDSYAIRELMMGYGDMSRLPPFIIQACMAKDGRVQVMEPLNLADFHRVETVPMIREWVGRFEDMPMFAELFAPIPEAQELIVDPSDVQAMLDLILKAQAPIRKEIRQRDARRERDAEPMRQVHAQIISLKAA
jgi:hypothetical protein